MIDYYLSKGYTLEWIKNRIDAIIDRKKLTNTWKENGVNEIELAYEISPKIYQLLE